MRRLKKAFSLTLRLLCPCPWHPQPLRWAR